MAQESSNVYSKIIDLSTYLDSTPGTNAFIPFISNKGREKLYLATGEKSVVNEYGDDDIIKFGKDFREGLMGAKKYSRIAGSLWCLRVLPDDAQYSSILIYSDVVSGKPVLRWENVNGLTSMDDINTALVNVGDKKPITMLSGKYRGSYYNNYWINMTAIANSDNVILDIYTINSQNNEVLVRSYTVSQNEDAVDPSGESIFIDHVLDFYENEIASYSNTDNLSIINTIESDLPFLWFVIKANSETDKTFAAGDKVLVGTGTGAFTGHDDEIASTVDGTTWTFAAATSGDRYIISEDLTSGGNENNIATFTTSWAYESPVLGEVLKDSVADAKYYFSGMMWDSYEGYASIFSASNTTTDAEDKKKLMYGSEGSLIDNKGKVVPSVATTLLTEAYSGNIDPDLFDEESIDFDVVFAPGYPRDVKDAAARLVIFYRPDAVLFTDVGDVSSVADAIQARRELAYNDFHIGLYNNYSKIKHELSGQNIWVSPTYHLTEIIPYNDKVANIWSAFANFRRAKLVGIKDIRYKPIQGDRDNLYMDQLNTLVKWKQGYTMWEVLTTQTRTSALSNMPVVRLVLYIEKALKRFCRFYLFEDNSPVTWDAIQKEITQFLNHIREEGGLRNFSVDVGAGDYELKTKRCHVNVTLEAMTHIEKIDLNLFIVN